MSFASDPASGAPEASIVLNGDKGELDRLAEFVKQFAAQADLSRNAVLSIDLSLHEWVTNILTYGFQTGQTRPIISIRLFKTAESAGAEIEDNGAPFDLLKHPSPDTSLPLEKKPIGGLGIFMIRKFMDEVHYERRDTRNCLVLMKRLKDEGNRTIVSVVA